MILELSPPVSPGGTGRLSSELELFHYFRSEVAPKLAGALDQEYWTRNLLMHAQRQPVVWHTCNAIAAVQKLERLNPRWEYDLSGKQSSLEVQSYQQYLAAIDQMKKVIGKKAISDDEKQNAILVNVLFAVLALLRGNVAEFHVHILQSWRLVGTWKLWEQTRLYRLRDKHQVHPADSLLYLCIRIESICCHFRPLHHKPIPGWEDCKLPLRDDPFISATEAYFELELIYNAGVDITIRPGPKSVLFTESQMADAEYLRGLYRDRLKKWERKYREFNASCGEEDELAHAVLELRAMLMRPILFTQDVLTASELCWDSAAATFAKVISAAKDVIALCYATDGRIGANVQGKQARYQGRTFRVAPMVNETLYVVGRLCRTPAVRNRAAALLAHDYHLSPDADTLLYMHMTNAIRQVEERQWNLAYQFEGVASACGCSRKELFICDGHRVCSTCLDQATRSSAVLLFKTVDDVLNGRSWSRIIMHYEQHVSEIVPLSEL